MSRRTEETDRTIRIFEEEKELLQEASNFLKNKGLSQPDVAITLGSGLDSYSDTLNNTIRIPYADIPGFAASTAPGHEGALIAGEKYGKNLLIFSGRWHPYEGYTMEAVVFFVRVVALLGATRYILTNASGAINSDFDTPGLMLISDHINLTSDNPLIGPNYEQLGERFPDMSDLYNKALREKLKKAASDEGLHLYEGIYTMLKGPSLETPAEIRFLKTIGSDAVGMSSVPEAITAKHAGMEVIGISCLSNPAAGIGNKQIHSDDVLAAAESIAEDFAKIVNLAVKI